MVTFERIKKANESIKTTDIKGKEYADVNQRIKAFRMVYPDGSIVTEMISNENGICIFKASVYSGSDSSLGGLGGLLGIGHAYEKEGSSFINRTSYIENCETSAVGRALGMAGFGIDVSVASAEEVQNAMLNQSRITENQMAIIRNVYKGTKLDALLQKNGLERLEDMSMSKASDLIKSLKEAGKA